MNAIACEIPAAGTVGRGLRPLGVFGAAVAAALVYMVASMAAGAVWGMAGLKFPDGPATVGPLESMVLMGIGALLLGLVLQPIVRVLPGTVASRGAWLAFFVYITLGVNTAIEASVFTDIAHLGSLYWIFLPPIVASSLVLALLVPSRDAGGSVVACLRRLVAARGAAATVGRALLGALCFLPVYYAFGMLVIAVTPGLLEQYTNGALGLKIPAPWLIPLVQILRGSLFLAAVLPVLACVEGSRRRFALRLGLAYWILVGVFGLLQGSDMPTFMRIAHGWEILADSFVHAGLLVWLLVPRPGAVAGEAEAA